MLRHIIIKLFKIRRKVLKAQTEKNNTESTGEKENLNEC